MHLGVNPLGAASGQPGAAWPYNFNVVLQDYLNRTAGSDWYRYAAQNYVLFTDADVEQLAREIPLLPGFQNTYVFLTEFSPAQQTGWMPKMFWNWISMPRD